MKRILIVGKSPENQTQLSELLNNDFDTVFTAFGEDCYKAIVDEIPSLIILALTSSGEQTFETCLRLRSARTTRQVPIIVLADRDEADLHFKALYVGANDVIREPFLPLDFCTRIRSKLERTVESAPLSTEKRCGNLRLDPDTYECLVENRRISLSVLEFNLLKYFVENFGRVLSREEILKNVWKNVAVTERAIDTHIASLRKNIQDSNLKFQTMYGAGYALKQRPSC